MLRGVAIRIKYYSSYLNMASFAPNTLLTNIIDVRDTSSENLDNAITKSVSVLEKGGLIGIPTDTIYGVACLASNNEAIQAIYNYKGREQTKPLAICVSQISDIYKWCKVKVSLELLEDLLPGPVTLVMERKSELNTNLNPTHALVGVRIPNASIINKISAKCHYPLALTSANISSKPSSLSIEEFKVLWPKLDLVLDGGEIVEKGGTGKGSRLGSTVVDLSETGSFKLIRDGCAKDVTVAILVDKFNMQQITN